jgi:hypothetical protein
LGLSELRPSSPKSAFRPSAAKVAVPRDLFRRIPEMIDNLRLRLAQLC